MFEDIRKKFPVYEKNPDLIFLDTAASALKPYDMIDAITNCYSYEYANVHRGLYSLSSKLTKKFEDVRVKVSNFISSKSYENIIFTKSATEGINLVVEKFSEKYLSEGDEVIISYLEHHANIVPWHMAAQKYKFKVIPIELTNNSDIDYIVGLPVLVSVFVQVTFWEKMMVIFTIRLFQPRIIDVDQTIIVKRFWLEISKQTKNCFTKSFTCRKPTPFDIINTQT